MVGFHAIFTILEWGKKCGGMGLRKDERVAICNPNMSNGAFPILGGLFSFLFLPSSFPPTVLSLLLFFPSESYVREAEEREIGQFTLFLERIFA